MKRMMTMNLCRFLYCSAIWLTAVALGQAAAPALVDVAVFPPEVQLQTSRDFQAMVVQAKYANGITEDVTKKSRYSVANPALVKLQDNRLTPTADGKTELRVEFEGRTISVPVEVKDAQKDRPISFKLDVMPVFSKASCNMGSCHGAARGKDGFRLSLYGFDPDGDYHRITREQLGRRINLAVPEESLLLTKATGMVAHSGGQRFTDESDLYRTVLRWLETGAPQDGKDVAKPVDLEMYPRNMVLNGKGASQQLTVLARYSDGTTRDVTSLAYLMTNNDRSAEINEQGAVVAGERGEAFIMARFESMTLGSHVIVLPKDLEFEFPQVAANNYVDELVYAKLNKLRIAPSEVCSDEVFLRRVYLDVVGVPPTVEEYHRFMNDSSPNKREKLVDELLERKEFVEMWVMKWAELLQIRQTRQVSYKAALLYHQWLQDKIANNVPMDKMVQELLGSNGGTFTNPPTNYYQLERDQKKTAENVAQVFMGMRIQCAQCHNHPFDRWTMDDYYGFVAFFSQIGRKNAEDPRETIIYNSDRGEVNHPVGNRRMDPKFLGGRTPDVKGKDRRVILANWLASDENPYFAKNLANIVWDHFMGRGIIDPVDDVRVSNPPVNEELLDALGQKFSEYDYDFKRLVRDICTSRTYQLATQTNASNESDNRNFSHAVVRRLRAEVLLDTIAQVTDSKNKFKGLPLGARAVQIADGSTSTYFLTTFGRASRETVCSCEVKMEPNLSQALHLLNGSTVTNAINQGKLIDTRLKEEKTPQEIVEELYIRCLSRRPSEKEMSNIQQVLAEEEDQRKVLEDVFWALLNSQEFIFNH